MKINEQQRDSLRDVFCFLFEYNPYYAQIMKALSCNPYVDSTEQIYNALPCIKKEDIIEHQNEILTPYLFNADAEYDLTSGSSGNVLRCYKTKSEKAQLSINIWKKRKKIDSKVRPSNHISIFDKNFSSEVGKFYNTDRDVLISNFNKMMALNPRWISGPISIFERIAQLILEGCPYEKSNLYVVEFMGEYVEPQKRQFVENAFNCFSVNNYGAQEVWCMAFDCTKQKLHIQEDLFYIDYYQKSQDDYNELLLTSFNNRLMPIIKYRIGDIGKLINEPCDCQNNECRIELAGGRMGDIIFGTHILGNYFFDQITWDVNNAFGNAIFAFQVIQKTPNDFDVSIVKGADYADGVLEIITNRIKHEVNKKSIVTYSFVDSIPLGNTGKLKKFVPY